MEKKASKNIVSKLAKEEKVDVKPKVRMVTPFPTVTLLLCSSQPFSPSTMGLTLTSSFLASLVTTFLEILFSIPSGL